jgi:hypothetical protein
MEAIGEREPEVVGIRVDERTGLGVVAGQRTGWRGREKEERSQREVEDRIDLVRVRLERCGKVGSGERRGSNEEVNDGKDDKEGAGSKGREVCEVEEVGRFVGVGRGER